MHDNTNNARVVRTDIDKLLESYWKWIANWDELSNCDREYLKGLVWQRIVKDRLRE